MNHGHEGRGLPLKYCGFCGSDDLNGDGRCKTYKCSNMQEMGSQMEKSANRSPSMKWFEKLSGKYPRKTRFYHASPHRMPVGTVVRPARNLPQIKPQYNSKDFVYLTTSPLPHHTISPDVMQDDYAWHVYEVVPEGRIWPGEWNDIKAEKAVIIRYVGNAKGLYLHDKQKRKEQTERRNKRGEELEWNDPKFPTEKGPPPGTSTVNYQKIDTRGPYKVKGKEWMMGAGEWGRRAREEEKAREDFVRRMHERGGIQRRPGDMPWYAKVIELFAMGKRDEALGEILRGTSGMTYGFRKQITKELEDRGNELKLKLGL